MLRQLIFLVGTALFLCSITIAAAADYGSMSTEQLSSLRGTMFDKPQTERDAFRAEWQKRIEQMTEEQKQNYFSSGSGQGPGNRNANGIGDGSGRGRTNSQQGPDSQGNGSQGKGNGNNGNNGKGRSS